MPERERVRAVIRGAVQGVGFRPFVFRLAEELGLTGWVVNSAAGVVIEAEGPHQALEALLVRLDRDRPPRAFIQSFEATYLDPVGFRSFEIRPSIAGAKTALILPDIATCPDCLREVLDPADRRFRYPFTNCTNCGPRFTIITALPYDRPGTSMAGFAMCDACRAEYEDPRNRRFHAQPNACPACGPRLEAWDRTGPAGVRGDEALRVAAGQIREGLIVAVKGLGGFHLIVDARNEEAIRRLRRLKGREEKPLALMYPSLAAVTADCEVSEAEARLLLSPESPIVLLARRPRASHALCADQPAPVAPSVAPGNPYLGAMLPYTPLHHLLTRDLGFPIVATSGNVSDEPICTDEREAVERLGRLADGFLVHNRPIVRHADDSIVRIVLGRELVIRRARGYAPLPIGLRRAADGVLAVGAHLKNTVALGVGMNAFVSQHIGDLETPQAYGAFRGVIGAFERLYEQQPTTVACDLHPHYLSTGYANETGLPAVRVQHHYAHVLACMAENELDEPVLGVSWDGTGFGLDGTVWGGEFLRVAEGGFTRAAHLGTFVLPGGDQAVKEPRRAALGLLHAVFGDDAFGMADLAVLAAFTPRELKVLRQMMTRGLNVPMTSSAGRLFDAVASICGLRQRVRFEGQAAMELESAGAGLDTAEAYPFACRVPLGSPDAPMIVDWAPLVHALLDDVRSGVAIGPISARFHNALAEMIVAVARHVGEPRVALSGGCFQNRYLTERAVTRLGAEGFRPYWHQRIPPNDGGIALGQIVAATRSM
jgi:hydrogenase maturation protein HypF